MSRQFVIDNEDEFHDFISSFETKAVAMRLEINNQLQHNQSGALNCRQIWKYTNDLTKSLLTDNRFLSSPPGD
jgi:hypothetical protein